MLSATWFVLAGMAIVFATLGLLMLALTVLNHWLAPPPPAKSGSLPSPAPAAKTTRSGNA